MFLLKNSLLLLSTLIVAVSLWPTRCLIVDLPVGKIRRRLYLLFVFICLFVAGYVAYTIASWNNYHTSVDFIVPVIFFCGAIFVFLVSTLSLHTAHEIKRVYELEHESTTDPLMGICNRRSMESRLEQEFKRAKRYRHPFSIIMIDIDHFKQINDSCGHQVGDIVLKSFADLVTETVRESDVVCRYGGEELLIILPHTQADAAFHVAENLRTKIQSNDFLVEECGCDHPALHVTASFGVTTLCPRISTLHKLLGQADKALYFAKKQGRNMTVSCSDLDDAEKCENS